MCFFHIFKFHRTACFILTPTCNAQASTDQSVLDLEMANRIGWCAFSTIQLLGTIAVMSQVAWEVFAILIPVIAICVWYQVRISVQDSTFIIKKTLLPINTGYFSEILLTDSKRAGSASRYRKSTNSSSFCRITHGCSNNPRFSATRPVY